MSRIYVSSTFDDLEECRKHVSSALRKLGHVDVAMEYYVAENKRPLARCLEDVASCDAYVGIFAWRYGYVPPGETRSITELEYRRAVEAGKDCLILLLKETASWPVDRIELGAIDKIRALRTELGTNHVAAFFTGKDDIEARVMEAVYHWERRTGHQPVNRSGSVPFQAPPLPSHYVERKTIVRDTTDQLLVGTAEAAGVLVVSALHGLAGIGKTALATAVAHDPLVRKRFKDGILWAALGQTPDLLSHLTSWIQALGDRQYRPTTVIAATNYLRSLLYQSTVLLVLDDVWESEHAMPFLAGGPDCRLLVTTRRARVADDLGARLVSMEEMDSEEALALLRKRVENGRKAPLTPEELEQAAALAKETGYLPLALELMAALVARGYPWNEARTALSAEWHRRARGSSYQHPAQAKLEATLQLSLDYLRAHDPEAWERVAWLAVLPAGITLDPRAAAVLWELSEREAGHLVRSLADDAILQRRGNGFGLHDRMHDMAHLILTSAPPKGLGQTDVAAHRSLLDRYAKQISGRRWNRLADDGYIHSHLVWHLEQAEEPEAIHALLQLTAADGQHAWYAARDQLGQAAGFLADVRTGWRLATENAQSSLGRQCRYGLILASLHSLTQVISPKLLEMLVTSKVWSGAKALDYIRRTPSPNVRATSLTLLIPTLLAQSQGNLLEEVLQETEATIAAGLGGEPAAQLLASLAGYFTDAQQAKLVERAVELAGTSPEALRRLTPLFPASYRDGLLERACELCRTIEDPYKRIRLLADLISDFSSPKMKQTWTVVLQKWTDALVTSRKRFRTQPDEERALIRHLVTTRIDLPSDWLRRISSTLPVDEKDQILRVIEQRVPGKRVRKAAEPAAGKRFAKLIEKAHRSDLDELVSLVPQMNDRDEAVRTLVLAYRHLRVEEQGEILTRVAPHASATACERIVLELAAAGRESIGGQCVLAVHAADLERTRRFDTMMEDLHSLTEAYDREFAMVSIVRMCPVSVVHRALSTLQRIDDTAEQAGMVFVLAPYLSAGLSADTARYFENKGWNKRQIVTLTRMMADLSRAMSGGVLNDFVREAARLSSEWWIVEALSLTILRLSDREQLRAVGRAGSYITASDLQARLAGRLALRFAHTGHLDDAIETAMSVPVPGDRWILLADLAADLSGEGMITEAETAAAAIQDREERSKARAAIALHLAVRSDLKRAKAMAREIDVRHWREWIQTRLDLVRKRGDAARRPRKKRPAIPDIPDLSTIDLAAIAEAANSVVRSGVNGDEIREVLTAVRKRNIDAARRAARRFWTAPVHGDKTYLELIAEQPRPLFLRRLQELGPLLTVSLEPAEIDEVVCAIHEAGTWWP
jgi:hypothetical protein